MGSNKTYKLLHSNGNHEENARPPTESEKIFASEVTKDLISKIYKQLIQLSKNKQTKKKTQSKNGQKT